jgi:hypothetical protein
MTIAHTNADPPSVSTRSPKKPIAGKCGRDLGPKAAVRPHYPVGPGKRVEVGKKIVAEIGERVIRQERPDDHFAVAVDEVLGTALAVADEGQAFREGLGREEAAGIAKAPL